MKKYVLYYMETKNGRQGTEEEEASEESLQEMKRHFNMYSNAYLLKLVQTDDDGFILKETTIEDRRSWISAAVRLPEKHDRYSVVVRNRRLDCTTIGVEVYNPDNGEWYLGDDEVVLAWKSLESVPDEYQEVKI